MSCASCNGCKRVCNLVACPAVIEIGTIANVDTDVDVYIERVDGKTWKLQETSSIYGVVTVDVSDISEALSGANSFNIWITLRDENAHVEFTLESGEEVDCAVVSFTRVVNTDDESLSLSPQILQT